MLAELIRSGKIFIYPTDTIYGIGCDATNEAAVARIRAIKQRDEKPFSIIPPGESWVAANTHIPTGTVLSWGPFTYFVPIKQPGCVAPSVLGAQNSSLGLRMSAHWFSEEIKKAGVPFVSTSVNISGKPHMTSLEDLEPSIRDAADIIIYEGPIAGSPSQKIDLTKQP